VAAAFAAAAHWPALLDSPLFAGFLSAFCGCLSNLEGVAAAAWGFALHPDAYASRRRRAEALAWSVAVVVAHLGVALAGSEAVRRAMLRSEALAAAGFAPEHVW
jgi:hypothetical protein